MLGETLSDPHGVEEGGSMIGMGLLPLETIFEKQKTRTRVQGMLESIQGELESLSGTVVQGYEIHMGISTILRDSAKPLTKIKRINTSEEASVEEYKWDGAFKDNVYGSYIHGIFDEEAVTRKLILSLGKKLGLKEEDIHSVDFQQYKEQQYDELARILRGSLDMDAIYKIID
jgi:adenosylcobyric acid synthase